MKKRFLFYFSVVLTIVISVFLFAACNEEEEPAKINSIYLKDGSGEIYDVTSSNTYLGEFEYGATSANIIPSFKYYGKFSDNSERELKEDEYVVNYKYTEPLGSDYQNIDSLPDVPMPGFYLIEVKNSKDDGYTETLVLNFYIYKRSDAVYTLSLSDREWDYESEPATVTVNGYEGNVNYYYIDKSVYDNMTDEEKANIGTGSVMYPSERKMIDAGEYYVYAIVPETSTQKSKITEINASTSFTVTKTKASVKEEDLENIIIEYTYDINDGTDGLRPKAIHVCDIKTPYSNQGEIKLYSEDGTEISGTVNIINDSVMIDGSMSGTLIDTEIKLSYLDSFNYYADDLKVELVVNKAVYGGIGVVLANKQGAAGEDGQYDWVNAGEIRLDLTGWAGRFSSGDLAIPAIFIDGNQLEVDFDAESYYVSAVIGETGIHTVTFGVNEEFENTVVPDEATKNFSYTFEVR